MDFSAPFQRVIFFRLLWNCTPYCGATVIPMIFLFYAIAILPLWVISYMAYCVHVCCSASVYFQA